MPKTLTTHTLYRKYRPASFDDVIGQKAVVQTLSNAIKKKRIAHAYLFSGPRGVGKTTIARILAKEVGVTNPIDLVEIDAASNRGIDDIRQLREGVKFSPTSGLYKVYIIDEVHMLTKEAFNALLKTLEEPPEHALFVLCTTESHRVPATITSRSQHFFFRKLTVAQLSERIEKIAKAEKIKIDPPAITYLSHLADGSVRDAESLLGQVFSLQDKHVTLEEVQEIVGATSLEHIQKLTSSIIKKDSASALKELDSITSAGIDISYVSDQLVEYIRNLLAMSMDAELGQELSASYTKEQQAFLKKLAGATDPTSTTKLLRALISAREQSASTHPPQLPLEIVIVEHSQDNVANTVNAETKQNPNPIAKDLSGNANINISVDFLQIKNKWSTFLEHLKKKNHSLLVCLQNSRPLSVEGDTLLISVPFQFHIDRLRDIKNRPLVHEALLEAFGQKIAASFMLEPEAKKKGLIKEATPEKKTDKSITNEALKVFGGQVIKPKDKKS